ncbi:Pterin-binding [Heracleum sosnowskyi]|uniref:Pterin-binding n=1 Tax=Heracleum sosnowskyi TaxID=360622 RepID=A0AAD8H1D7_9APIA|nr:Pterin-binding [Heracleum sosnowskyi]
MEKLGGQSLIGKDGMKRVLPVGKSLWDWSVKTSVMGADIIDIGAQSSRPMASRISPEEEHDRLIPVASEAVSKGAHLVNDVSGGQLDSKMLDVVVELKVPYVAMHMRGNPSTMQNSENLQYGDVCKDVASELCMRARDAELSGIPAWKIIIDPGIGFSKKKEDNLDILMGLPTIRTEIARKSLAVSHAPLLIGPSRKRFLGDICSHSAASDRDLATVSSVTLIWMCSNLGV